MRYLKLKVIICLLRLILHRYTDLRYTLAANCNPDKFCNKRCLKLSYFHQAAL